MSLQVESNEVHHFEDKIESVYTHRFTTFDSETKKVKIESKNYSFRT